MNSESPTEIEAEAQITVRNLTLGYGSVVLMRDLNFTVKRGDVFIIMGASGWGKSTLLRNMIGLIEPSEGEIFYEKANFTRSNDDERRSFFRRFGVLYQSGGLWSSLTLAENVALPLEEYTDLGPVEIREIAFLSSRWSDLTALKIITRLRSAAECGSAWDWPAPSRSTPRCFSLMNLRLGSIPSIRAGSTT
jgi:ABC-type transporter Mla maintaining outer membrane lipid asymmetry ATPase subunit MlaF